MHWSGVVLAICVYAIASAHCEASHERRVLEALYGGASGDDWTRRDGWLGEGPVCLWHGVECSDDGVIRSIVLSGNGLRGTIPEEIGELTSLSHLDLSLNALEGTIPSTVGSLVALEKLYLTSNSLTGTIPEALSALVGLNTASFAVNKLVGPLPSFLNPPHPDLLIDLSFNSIFQVPVNRDAWGADAVEWTVQDVESWTIVERPAPPGATPLMLTVLCRGVIRGTEVAIKRVLLDEKEQGLLRESEILSSISHPAIIEFMGFIADAGGVCLPAELPAEGEPVGHAKRKVVPGATVFRWMPSGSVLDRLLSGQMKEIPVLKRMSIARDFLSAVEHLHGMSPSILHRDIRASNLLFNENDDVVLSDFSAAVPSKLRVRPGIVGYPIYMAPEMVQYRRASRYTDVYSTCVLVCEILSAARAYSQVRFNEIATRPEELLYHVVERGLRPQVPMSSSLAPIPFRSARKLTQELESCLKSDPHRRPSAGDLRVLVDEALAAAHREHTEL